MGLIRMLLVPGFFDSVILISSLLFQIHEEAFCLSGLV
jgi:hypothetical protein